MLRASRDGSVAKPRSVLNIAIFDPWQRSLFSRQRTPGKEPLLAGKHIVKSLAAILAVVRSLVKLTRPVETPALQANTGAVEVQCSFTAKLYSGVTTADLNALLKTNDMKNQT